MTYRKDFDMDVGTKIAIGWIVLGWIGTITGWGVTIFRSGRAYGMLKTRVGAVENDIVGLKEDTSNDIEKLHKSIEKLLRCFTTRDGEQRFVSYTALDKIRQPCREGISQRFDATEKAVEKHDKKLDTIIKGIATINGKLNNGNGLG